MSFYVEYGAMKGLLGTYSNAVSSWSSGIKALIKKEAVVETSTNISGNSADRLREYLNAVYNKIYDSLSKLLGLFYQNFLLYTDDYYQSIDAACDTRIQEADLDARHENLQTKRSHLQQIGLAAENAIQGITDLVELPNLDVSGPDSFLGNIITSLDNLDNEINSLENAHIAKDFTEIDSLLDSLEAFLKESYVLDKEFKTSFSADSLSSLASFPALQSALSIAEDRLISNKTNALAAEDRLEKRLEQEQAEYEKRKEKAGWAKIGFGIAVGLVSSVAIIACPALAGPLGMVIVGSLSGATTAVLSASADEYAEHGWNTYDWDTDRIVAHGSIGAITGAIGGSIAPGMGTCAKAGIKAGSSAIEGVLSTSYDQYRAYGQITDIKEIAGDAFIKGTSTFIGSVAGSKISESVGDFVKKDETIKDLAEHVVGGKDHFGAVLKIEGASGLASGIVKRFTGSVVTEIGGFVEALVEGESVSEAYEEHNIIGKSIEGAFDLKNLVSDGANALIDSAIDDPLRDSEVKLEYYRDKSYYVFGDAPDLNGKPKAWNDWNSEEYDRMMTSLAELDAREDPEGYAIFGDPREFTSQRNSAIDEAWEAERRLVLQGRGTRDWTVSQQEELIRTGKVSGFDGSHMLDASSNPSVAGNQDNIQFLTYEEHVYGAHDGNTHNQTTGRFDPVTGETEAINPRQIPHREELAFELTDKFDYTQLDVAEQLGSSFGYERGNNNKN